jgi:hypothetical protein
MCPDGRSISLAEAVLGPRTQYVSAGERSSPSPIMSGLVSFSKRPSGRTESSMRYCARAEATGAAQTRG